MQIFKNLQNFENVGRGNCRSRQELSNACLVAKIGLGTAENEPFFKLETNKWVST